jgi:PepSY-associated transmembrane protein
MWHLGSQLKRSAIFVHRWMGVCFCLLFLMWFTSGIVMMYWDYPAVSNAERLQRTATLQASKVHLSPDQAYDRLETDRAPTQVRLGMQDGRPAYRFRLEDVDSMVYADNGETLAEISPEMALRIASSWVKQPPAAARVEMNTEEDQWTVSASFWAFRPMFKYSWPNGEEVYVSSLTGDVVQHTTRASRIGAYFGAIPHWLYFTPLRKHGAQWSRIVIWGSGLAALTAIIGITIGLWMYSPGKRYLCAGVPSAIPYTGQKRWHMILGLSFGLIACTWAFSGMLSMDPFPQMQGESGAVGFPSEAIPLPGGPLQLAAYSIKDPREALAQLGSDFKARELEFTSLAGEPAYLATMAPQQTRVIPLRGEPQAEFDRARIVEVVRQAAQPFAPAEVREVTRYEAYYVDRHHERPLPVILVRLNDSGHSTFYIDPRNARIVQSYNSRARWNRWLYHGLHSIDLPWLYRHRPAWDIVVLLLMLGGAALCVTSLILAWRVLSRKLNRSVVDRSAATSAPDLPDSA